MDQTPLRSSAAGFGETRNRPAAYLVVSIRSGWYEKKIPEILLEGKRRPTGTSPPQHKFPRGAICGNNFLRASWGPPTPGIGQKKGDDCEKSDRYSNLRLCACRGLCRTEQSSGSSAHDRYWPSDCLKEIRILFWCLEDLAAKRSEADQDEIGRAVHFALAAMPGAGSLQTICSCALTPSKNLLEAGFTIMKWVDLLKAG